MSSYVEPEVGKDGFNCPFCSSFAEQKWGELISAIDHPGFIQIMDGNLSRCERCKNYSIWIDGELVYPKSSSAPKPVSDMPDDVKEDFIEARKVVEDSPRAAAALLRLSMEKLTNQLLDESNDSLYQNIGELVEQGRIDSRIQKALDSVRVTGNDYVHAGEIYGPDDKDTALRLFDLVNTIVYVTISQERVIEQAYSEIPENKKEGIDQRDQ
ncbi:DUF4145 domain-containing protein [Halorubellus salinus]|uniref:DUF4145 domain-containing protein n=1 Tax=Halorubellus salinus TaxID=755309 RepID=UPI001D0693AE|nr:DUF4145 domain-containing protein [Halorubellus salinus]